MRKRKRKGKGGVSITGMDHQGARDSVQSEGQTLEGSNQKSGRGKEREDRQEGESEIRRRPGGVFPELKRS